MSRHAKLSQPNILTRPVQKPNEIDHSTLVREISNLSIKEEIHPFPRKNTKRLTVDDISADKPTRIEIGAARRAANLYKAMEATPATLPTLASTSALFECSPGFSHSSNTNTFQTFSSHSHMQIKSIKGARTITFSKRINHKKRLEALQPLLSYKLSGSLNPKTYFLRFFFASDSPEEVIILTIAYLERALAVEKSLRREHFQKLFVGCYLLAFKYLVEGSCWMFKEIGFLGQVDPKEVEGIEKCVFQEVFGLSLYLTSTEFEKVKEGIIAESL